MLHRLTGMLMRRPFLFFGIFFALPLLDSISVLPIFLLPVVFKTAKQKKKKIGEKFPDQETKLVVFPTAVPTLTSAAPLYSLLRQQQTRRRLVHQEVARLYREKKRGRAHHIRHIVYRCSAEICHPEEMRFLLSKENARNLAVPDLFLFLFMKADVGICIFFYILGSDTQSPVCEPKTDCIFVLQ